MGTDDGNVQVTQDGGKTWTNVVGNVKGLPPNSWVSRINASHFNAGTAYVAIDRHQENDFAPYAYMTADYGKTWTALQAGLPAKGYVHVVREDPKNQDLLYLGTELGVFASWDRGRTWADIRNGLPPVAVRDIKVHPRDNDLIIASHGRGAWIIDDIAPLQKLTAAMAQDAYLFDPRPAVRWTMWSRAAARGAATWQEDNPPDGAYLNFYLKTAAPVEIAISNARGQPVRNLRANAGAGVNRVVWDLRYVNPGARGAGPGGAGGGAGGEEEGGGGRGRGGRGGATPYVVPGDYTATLRAGGRELHTSFRVEADPRVQTTLADYQAQYASVLELQGLANQVNDMVTRGDDIKRQLVDLEQTIRRNPGSVPGANASLVADLKVAQEKLAVIVDSTLRRPPPNMGYRQYPRLREELNSLLGGIARSPTAPTDPQKTRSGELRTETAQAVAAFNAFVEQTIGAINRKLGGAPRIVTGRLIS